MRFCYEDVHQAWDGSECWRLCREWWLLCAAPAGDKLSSAVANTHNPDKRKHNRDKRDSTEKQTHCEVSKQFPQQSNWLSVVFIMFKNIHIQMWNLLLTWNLHVIMGKNHRYKCRLHNNVKLEAECRSSQSRCEFTSQVFSNSPAWPSRTAFATASLIVL